MFRTFLIFSALLLSSVPSVSQSSLSDSTRSTNRNEYWQRFETEFNRFIGRAVDGFRPPEDFEAPPDSLQIATAEDSLTPDDQPELHRAHWSWSGNSPDEAKFARFGIPRRVSWLDEQTIPADVILRYNRVEGLFLGLGEEKRYYWNDGRAFAPYGTGGYAFRAHRWWGTLGLARQIAIPGSASRLLEFGIEGYVAPDSKDSWLISQGENTAAAFLIHEDYRDYYERRGFTLHAAYYVRHNEAFGEASLAYLVDQHYSLENRTEWSLFGPGKEFRLNPAVNEGKLRSGLARLGFSTATGSRLGVEGWDMHGTAELAGKAFGGMYVFEQYIADIRRYQPLGKYDNLNLRLRIGTAHGELPQQRAFELGGLGSMPAYRFKEFAGDSLTENRMLLINAEYIVNGDVLNELPFWPSFIMHHINLIFVADAGVVRRADPTLSPLAGFGGLTWEELRTDVGLGLSNRNGSFRIGATWRTDRAEPARLMLRLAAPF